jgi:hypothetical protein
MKKLIALLIFLSFRFILFGQDEMKSGIIYGNNHAFSLTAPRGWVLDNEAGVSQGLYAVFYKRGESWQNGETVMYTNTASLEDSAYSTLDQLIKYDLDNFKKNYPDIKITDGNDVLIKKNVVAKIKYLSGESYGNYEAMAYIDAGKTGVMIIMTSRTQSGFENSLKAFEELVKSYFFISENVIIDHK